MKFRAAFLALVLAFAAGGAGVDAAWARPGMGGSIGSRGSRTYFAPQRTQSAPYAASPFQRNVPPPMTGRPYGMGAGAGMGGAAGMMARHPLASGFMGGLLGAGIAGMLIGHGMAGGLHGGGSLLGLLIQIGLLVLVVRWLMRRFGGGNRGANPGAGFASNFAQRFGTPAPAAQFGGPAQAAQFGAQSGAPPGIAIGRSDYTAFEGLLRELQRAWTDQDMNALGRLATPEMVAILADELREISRTGGRNSVTETRLDKGELTESWREGPLDYATVAMRYSMIDVTRDPTGRVLDGSPIEHVTANEFWTFVRRQGGNWVLSAIQQA